VVCLSGVEEEETLESCGGDVFVDLGADGEGIAGLGGGGEAEGGDVLCAVKDEFKDFRAMLFTFLFEV